MTKSQKLAIEISAKQRELSRLSNLDKPTTEDKRQHAGRYERPVRPEYTI